MARGASIGTGRGLDGRVAAREAAQAALDGMGTARPSAALILAAHEYPPGEVLGGLMSMLGNIPFWGFSTNLPFTIEGEQPHSVVVAILSGVNWKFAPQWQPQFYQESAPAAQRMERALNANDEFEINSLLLAADGIQGDTSRVCSTLTGLPIPIAGGLAAGDVQAGKTYQFSGNQWGSGALAGLALGGRMRLGVGLGHGWRDSGIQFTISKTREVWLQELDHITPAEAYSRIFGKPAHQWTLPPLAQLARLYPLGLESGPGSAERIIRSPLQVETDGSFRMNTPLAAGDIGHLMIGDPQACLDSARQAFDSALKALNGARPVAALAMVDIAWHYLFEAYPQQLTAALKEKLGEIPLLGAYSYGQVARLPDEALVRLHNQAFLAAVIGEA